MMLILLLLERDGNTTFPLLSLVTEVKFLMNDSDTAANDDDDEIRKRRDEALQVVVQTEMNEDFLLTDVTND